MAKKTSKASITQAVVVSDTHFGSCLALCHPDGAERDAGGIYQPSQIQRTMWDWWQEFWYEWVPQATGGEPFVVIHNGDLTDGVHHGDTTQWSHDMGDQVAHAEKVMKPIVELCEGRYYQIRGTAAHVGVAGVEEERFAKAIGALPNEDGRYSRFELWLRLGGKSGPLCHFLHHIGTTSSAQHETSAVNAELTAMYAEAGRWRKESPLFVVRSHRHRCSEVRLPAPHGYATVFVTAAWQLKTPYAWKIAGARVTTPQIGGSLIRVSGEGEWHARHWVKDIGRSNEEVV